MLEEASADTSSTSFPNRAASTQSNPSPLSNVSWHKSESLSGGVFSCMSLRVLPSVLLLVCLRGAAQDCAGAPKYTTEELEGRDAAECSVLYAPACQRIRPASADTIFVGTVSGVVESDGHTVLDGDCSKTLLQTVTVKVGESFVGNESGTVTIRAGGINGFYFRSRESYLMFARRLKDGSLTVTSCGGTKLLRDATEDREYLRSWESRPIGAS